MRIYIVCSIAKDGRSFRVEGAFTDPGDATLCVRETEEREGEGVLALIEEREVDISDDATTAEHRGIWVVVERTASGPYIPRVAFFRERDARAWIARQEMENGVASYKMMLERIDLWLS